MALNEATKVKVRRHLRYGVAGLYKTSAAGGTLAVGQIGYRFFQPYGNLEYRMNNLSPVEEATVTGAAMGAVSFVGPNPTAGDQFVVALSGGGLSTVQQVTVTAVNGDTPTTIGSKVAAAIALNTTIAAAGFYAVALYGAGPFGVNQQIPLPEVAIVGPQPFTLGVTTTSALAPQVTMQGQQMSPSADFTGAGDITYGFIPILDALESAIASASQNLDTKQADVWKHHGNELAQRRSLYEDWQFRFSEFIGIPMNESVPEDRFKNVGVVRYN